MKSNDKKVNIEIFMMYRDESKNVVV